MMFGTLLQLLDLIGPKGMYVRNGHAGAFQDVLSPVP